MDGSVSHEQTTQIVDICSIDLGFAWMLRKLGESEVTDVTEWGAAVQKHHDAQSVRRMYVRLFISYVESVLATIRGEILEEFDHFSAAERAALTEITYDITDQGKPTEKALPVSLLKGLRFTFWMYAEVYGLDASPDYGGEGWRAFQDAVRIRNRITHPKQVASLAISDMEVARVDEAYRWFHEAYVFLIEAFVSKFSKLR